MPDAPRTSTTSPAQLRDVGGPGPTFSHPLDYVRRRRFGVDARSRHPQS